VQFTNVEKDYLLEQSIQTNNQSIFRQRPKVIVGRGFVSAHNSQIGAGRDLVPKLQKRGLDRMSLHSKSNQSY
jgi:hypothetical protein